MKKLFSLVALALAGALVLVSCGESGGNGGTPTNGDDNNTGNTGNTGIAAEILGTWECEMPDHPDPEIAKEILVYVFKFGEDKNIRAYFYRFPKKIKEKQSIQINQFSTSTPPNRNIPRSDLSYEIKDEKILITGSSRSGNSQTTVEFSISDGKLVPSSDDVGDLFDVEKDVFVFTKIQNPLTEEDILGTYSCKNFEIDNASITASIALTKGEGTRKMVFTGICKGTDGNEEFEFTIDEKNNEWLLLNCSKYNFQAFRPKDVNDEKGCDVYYIETITANSLNHDEIVFTKQ